MKLLFTLAKPARKSGGDRYHHLWNDNPNDVFVIYVPQSISRPSGTPVNKLHVEFSYYMEE